MNGTVTAASMGYARASDSLITVDGLKSYSPFSAADIFTDNYSWTYFSAGVNGMHYRADSLSLDFTYNVNTNQTVLILRDLFSKFNGTQNAYEAGATGIGLTSKIIATSAPAVPEPETYVMLIAGLVLLSYATRLRTRK